jgi:regulator of replication initiation timing
MSREFTTSLLEIWSNPLFAKGFLEFSAAMQQAGIEAARRSWEMNHRGETFPWNAPELFERMIAFYSDLGFVSKKAHDEVLEENERLKEENEFLKTTLRELNLKIYREASLPVQEMWKETLHKQMEMSTEIAKSFLDLFRQQGGE